jgi:CDP-glucose 4,6-dehydratase
LTPEELRSVYRGRRVLVTGHTGFAGGWLTTWLAELGARVGGYSLAPATEPNLFTAARVADSMVGDTEGDIRDLGPLEAAWRETRPEVVFHLASQPLAVESVRDPLAIVTVNLLGVAHVLELARRKPSPTAVILVMNDRGYELREGPYPYRETDPIGGHDVSTASRTAAEQLALGFRDGPLADRGVGVACVRVGSAIGGGDWTRGILVPDCVRALADGQAVQVRHPRTVRPWQHILEPLSGYLTLGGRLLASGAAERQKFSGAWNFGPARGTDRTVWELVEAMIANWGSGSWERLKETAADREGTPLHLSIDKAREMLGWQPHLTFEETVSFTVDWYRAFYAGDDMGGWCRRQIASYMEPAEDVGG